MTFIWTNNAQSTIAGSINAAAVSVTLATGTGSRFPNPGAGQQFALTFNDAATGLLTEIVYCTARSGDTLTIARAQEGTVAQSWASGDLVANLITAGTLTALLQQATNNVGFVNLIGNAPGGTKTAAWSVDQITAATALNGINYAGANVSLTFNGAGTGPNGMDTGLLPISGDVIIYAIYNSNTQVWSTLGCLSTTSNGPVYQGGNMPAGYSASCIIFAGCTDASRNINTMSQVDKSVFPAAPLVANNLTGAHTPAATIGFGGAAPFVAKSWAGYAFTNSNSGAIFFQADPVLVLGAQGVSAGSANAGGVIGDIPFVSSRNTFYTASGSGVWNLFLSKYTF